MASSSEVAFRVGDTFASFYEFKSSLEQFEKEQCITYYKRDCRTLEAASKRVNLDNPNADLFYRTNSKPGFRITQRENRKQNKANPPSSKRQKGTFSGGMSKRRRAKGIAKKRKLNVSTNSTPSGKKLRKLLKERLRNEREANKMQVEITSLPKKRSRKNRKRRTRKSKGENPQKQGSDSGGEGDVNMTEV